MKVLKTLAGGAICGLFLFSLPTSAGEMRFRGSFVVSGVSRPVTVHAGDVDGNGKLDLIASNGGGTVFVYFQDAENRKAWTQVGVPVGAACFFTRAGDFDGDGYDDLAVADGGSTTYVVRSRGDRTFDPPISIPEARGSRWIALGDWDKDGNLDLASSNLATGTLTIFVGDGEFNFRLTGFPPSQREHTLESLDYDGDGILDLALGTGLPGTTLHRGQGDGTFVRKNTVHGCFCNTPGYLGSFGCVEYIAVGDFNNDGLDDMAPTCIDDRTAYAGMSEGDGTYTLLLKDGFGSGTESSAIGDLDGDGNADLALVSNGSSLLRVYRSKGDGTFEAPIHFGHTGLMPVFLIAEDLDGDGRLDVVSADSRSEGLTVFFGQEGEQFLESDIVSGYGTAKAYAIADFDRDRRPDFFFAESTREVIHVFLAPGMSAPMAPNFSITTASRYSFLDVVDLNGDGIVDLAGGNTGDNVVLTSLIDAEGKASEEQSIPCGGGLKYVAVGFLDDGPTVDIVALSTVGDVFPATDYQLSIFLGHGDGTFDAVPAVATIGIAKVLDSGDIDGDGRADIAVLATKEIAIHYGLDGGGFSAPARLVQNAGHIFRDIEVVDLDGDGKVDVVVGEKRRKAVFFHRGKGAREFEDPIELNVGETPNLVEVVDIDMDGDLDIAVGSAGAKNIGLLFNLGAEGFSTPQIERTGVSFSLLRVLDVDGDRVNDLVAFGSGATSVLLGETDTPPPPPPGFRRGDADDDGRVLLNDAVVVLEYLFRRGVSPSCPDAADSNDDTAINITDAVWVLNYLFLGGAPPAPPGPTECGEDTTGDELPECATRC